MNRLPPAKTFRLLAAILAALTLPSCAYLTDRGVDFLDQYRAVGGVETGGGLRFSYLGLVSTGINFGIKPQATSLGWKYGRPFLLSPSLHHAKFEGDQAWVIYTTTLENCNYASADYKLARRSVAVLPFFLTWADTTYRDGDRWYVPEEGVSLAGDNYIWTGKTWRNNRYAMIHALDMELEMGALAYLDLGYSPGEALDFLLGIFTIDLARDDGRIISRRKK
jgi:hypothetical protein